jgi:hypothetical protein
MHDRADLWWGCEVAKKHTPVIDPEEDLYIVPDTSEGAYTNCDCADCREARLADPDRIYYSAHEMADAWSDGWRMGASKACERMNKTLEQWVEDYGIRPTD